VFRPAIIAATAFSSIAGAQKPVPKAPPTVPGIILPSVSQLTVMSTPNFNTSDPFSLFALQKARIRADLTGTAIPTFMVNVRYGSALTGPSSVSVPSGQRFVEFEVTAMSVAQEVTTQIRGWVVDTSLAKFTQLRVKPGIGACQPTPTISLPASVRRNSSVTISIGLSCVRPTATTVQVTSSLPGTIPPPPGNVITIPANAQSGSYTTTTANVVATTVVTFSAFIVGTNPLVRAPDMQIAVTTQ
jgi:hypothetical protein